DAEGHPACVGGDEGARALAGCHQSLWPQRRRRAQQSEPVRPPRGGEGAIGGCSEKVLGPGRSFHPRGGGGGRGPSRRKPMHRRSVVKLGLAGLALGVARMPTASAQGKLVLKATDVHPLGYPTVEAVVRMGKKLEAATNDRISIQMYPSMQLGGEKEMIEQ